LTPDDPHGEAAGDALAAGAPAAAADAPPGADAPSASAAPVAETRLIAGRYRVERRLGGGGMAEVFLAQDTTLGRLVAVKVLRERFAGDEQFVARFHREARAAAALNHPNVVAIHDRGGSGGSSHIVMEYVSGETLKDRVQRGGRLTPAAARDIELGLLAALRAAHDGGVIHRDVTAQNVLLTQDGRVKVADFGIAHFGSSELTSTGIVMGTSRYLAPEQARGEATDERSDLYSAGVVLFEMLTGRLPFEGDNDLAIAVQHANDPAPSPAMFAPDLPPALDAIVGKALRKNPAERFQTAAEFFNALAALDLGAGGGGAAAPAGAVTSATVVVSGAVAGAGIGAATAATRVVAPAAASDLTAATRVGPAAARAVAVSRRRRRLWVALAVLVVLAAALAGVLTYRAQAGRSVTVPSVRGLTVGRATSELRRRGFAVRSTGGYSDAVAPGAVMAQHPTAGVSVKKGLPVHLIVSRGLLHPAVVSVAGATPAAAAAALQAQGFVAVRLAQHSSTVRRGLVIYQSPVAGTPLLRGSVVRYWVSKGPPKVQVPDVVGASEGSATDTLKSAGFSVAVNTTLGLGDFPGNVTEQKPSAGSLVPKGTRVTIWVAVL
jgi:eukaryotic-like serine/threonine-protein kinase